MILFGVVLMSIPVVGGYVKPLLKRLPGINYSLSKTTLIGLSFVFTLIYALVVVLSR
jgi:hypothetical protein